MLTEKEKAYHTHADNLLEAKAMQAEVDIKFSECQEELENLKKQYG